MNSASKYRLKMFWILENHEKANLIYLTIHYSGELVFYVGLYEGELRWPKMIYLNEYQFLTETN